MEEDWSNNHPQIHVEDGDSACVDVELAPLILALWRLGIRTDGSCQDVRGRVFVDSFDPSLHLIRTLLRNPRWLRCDGKPAMGAWWVSFPRQHLPLVIAQLRRAG